MGGRIPLARTRRGESGCCGYGKPVAERLTGAEFIARAREKHCDRYDYSFVQYVNSQAKVTIICQEHGEFQQAPAKHLHGQGCGSCGGRVRLTTQRFINRSRRAHGDRYDYSLAEYVNNRNPVTIFCGDHGRFQQRPETHMAGGGCPRCADRESGLARTGTTAAFLVAAAEVHGDRYRYTEVRYVNSETKVTIICAEHGPFEQLPGSHLRGVGCPTCGTVQRAQRLTSSTEEFVLKARAVRGEAYDYSRVEYVKARLKVTIGCPAHGDFQQTPNSHLSGGGCPSCAQETITRAQTDTAESFIKKALHVHGERYDYSQVEYLHSQIKVTIRCREHGAFPQFPSSHLIGSGCPRCAHRAVGTANADTAASFVEKAQRVHGERYEYTQVEYVRSQVEVTIVCPEHGPFHQVPNSHLSGRGCPECGLRSISLARAGNLDSFLDRAFVVHGSRFDYSRVTFAGSHIKAAILCRDHGEFRQTPASHLNGSGCPSCATEARRIAIAGTSDLFVARAEFVHGDTYDYSDVEYRNAMTPVVIICRRHGPFTQIPPVHLGGSGCRRCSTSKGEIAVARLLTRLGLEYEHQWRDHDCRDLRVLAFDFALIGHRMLIEFDGPQHRQPVRWGSMSQAEAVALFDGVLRRDRIKDDWAVANGWRMLRLTDATTVEQDLTTALVAGGLLVTQSAGNPADEPPRIL